MPNPQKSDVFSLGCVMLDIMTALMERSSRAFAAHRAAKQVEEWIKILAEDASKKDDELFRGVISILHVISSMTAVEPRQRPSAAVARDKIDDFLKQLSGIDVRLDR
jgi:serine/threonine protein kinase